MVATGLLRFSYIFSDSHLHTTPHRKCVLTFKKCFIQQFINSNPPFFLTFTASATKKSSAETGFQRNFSSVQLEQRPLSNVFEALENLGMSKRSVKLLMRANPNFSDLSATSFSSTISVLDSLQISDKRLIRLIKKHTLIFTLDLETTLSPAISEIPDLNLQKIGRILFHSNPEILTSLLPKLSLLRHHRLSKSDISGILNRVNLKVFLEKNLEDLDSVLIFLQSLETNHNHHSLLLRHPSLLLLDLETELKPFVTFFRSLVSDSGALRKLLWRFPVKRWFTVQYLQSHIDFLRSSGFSGRNIQAILRSYPQIFTLSIDRKIKPRIEFLRKCGLDQPQIVKTLTSQPSFLGLSFDDNVSKKADFLTTLGFRRYSRAFARTLSTVTRIAYEKLTVTAELLMRYGLSREEICRMCEKQPHVLRYTCECLEPKMEYLVKEMGLGLHVLVEFPTCLGYSLENRIKPRHEAMSWLVARGLAKENYSVNRLLSLSNRDFSRLTAGTGFCETAD